MKEKIKNQEIIETIEPLNIMRVEYYDDRFYKITLDNKFLPRVENINQNLIVKNETDFDLYSPSVTTILGTSNPMPFLAKWRGDVGNITADFIMANAMDLGSHVHSSCEHYAKGFPVVYRNEKTDTPKLEMLQDLKDIFFVKSQEAMIMVNRFEKLLDLFKPNILEIERTVYQIQDNICYAGTLDYLMEIEGGVYELSPRTKIKLEGGIYVIDIKSGKTVSDENFIQTSAYSKALPEEIKGNMIWHLNADRRSGIIGANVLSIENDLIDIYYKQFLNFYETFLFKNPDLKPKLYEYKNILYKPLNK